MAKILTAKEEEFVRKYLETGNTVESYLSSYDVKTKNTNSIARMAWVVLNKEKVQKRIEQIRNQVMKKTLVTVESITDELDRAIKEAYTLGNVSAAVSAIMGKAKLHGLEIKKIEQNTTHTMRHEVVLTKEDVLTIKANLDEQY